MGPNERLATKLWQGIQNRALYTRRVGSEELADVSFVTFAIVMIHIYVGSMTAPDRISAVIVNLFVPKCTPGSANLFRPDC